VIDWIESRKDNHLAQPSYSYFFPMMRGSLPDFLDANWYSRVTQICAARHGPIAFDVLLNSNRHVNLERPSQVTAQRRQVANIPCKYQASDDFE